MLNKATIKKIRAASIDIEKNGSLPRFVMDIIYAEKLFKLFIPKKEGGKMLPLPAALRIFDETARINGNLGWAVTIGAGGGYFYSYMQPAAAHRVFSPKKALIAGSGHPSAIAEKMKGGYRVTGQWKYASGAPYATAFTANAIVKSNKKGLPTMLAFTFLPTQVHVIKDWDAFGMKATESYSFNVENTFIPDDRVFDLTNHKLYYKAPIYRYPFLLFAETSFASLVIGLGRHFMEEAHFIIQQNKKLWSTSKRYAIALEKLDKAAKDFYAVSKLFYAKVDASWVQTVKHDKPEERLQNEVSKLSKQVSRVVLACADELMQYLGMQAVMQHSTINLVWRDIHTACQHVLLVPFE